MPGEYKIKLRVYHDKSKNKRCKAQENILSNFDLSSLSSSLMFQLNRVDNINPIFHSERSLSIVVCIPLVFFTIVCYSIFYTWLNHLKCFLSFCLQSMLPSNYLQLFHLLSYLFLFYRSYT